LLLVGSMSVGGVELDEGISEAEGIQEGLEGTLDLKGTMFQGKQYF